MKSTFVKMLTKSLFLLSVFSLQSCLEPDCDGYPKSKGTINLTTHDKNVFFNTYQLNQTVKFIRNNKDTIIFQISNSYYSNELFYPFDENIDCGYTSKYEQENHGIYLFTTLEDTIFYLHIKAVGEQLTDTLSNMSFGTNPGGFISLDTDKIYTDSLLINNVQINGANFNKVYHYVNPNTYRRIKDVYFHRQYGIIKFSFYARNSHSIEGDRYEIIL